MSELIKELWMDTNMLLRYVLSGFVVLLVAWAADDRHTVLKELADTAGSPWPVLLLAPVLGFVLFSVHTAICYPTYGFWAYWWGSNHGWKDRVKAKEEHLDVLIKRWEARVGKQDKKSWAREQMFLAWSSQTHFLYCSALALFFTPIILWWVDRDAAPRNLIVSGIMLFVLAFFSDRRMARLVVRHYISKFANSENEELDQSGKAPI